MRWAGAPRVVPFVVMVDEPRVGATHGMPTLGLLRPGAYSRPGEPYPDGSPGSSPTFGRLPQAVAARAHDLDFAHRSDRKSTRLNSSHSQISYAVFCLKNKKHQ